MTIKKKKKITIDLHSSQGNAFVLLATAKTLTKEKYPEDFEKRWEEISKKMKSSNYENLVKVFDEYFGEMVDLIK
jgi:orotate phosphoribosyltransferase-like protein